VTCDAESSERCPIRAVPQLLRAGAQCYEHALSRPHRARTATRTAMLFSANLNLYRTHKTTSNVLQPVCRVAATAECPPAALGCVSLRGSCVDGIAAFAVRDALVLSAAEAAFSLRFELARS